MTPTLPGPSPNASYYEPPVNPNLPPVSFKPQPVINPIPTSDPSDIPALSTPSSPPRQLREPAGVPSTPESPTFMTPPSSPSEPVNGNPEAISEPNPSPLPPVSAPEPQILPRRSTRVRIPTKRYDPAEYDLQMTRHIGLVSGVSVYANCTCQKVEGAVTGTLLKMIFTRATSNTEARSACGCGVINKSD